MIALPSIAGLASGSHQQVFWLVIIRVTVFPPVNVGSDILWVAWILL